MKCSSITPFQCFHHYCTVSMIRRAPKADRIEKRPSEEFNLCLTIIYTNMRIVWSLVKWIVRRHLPSRRTTMHASYVDKPKAIRVFFGLNELENCFECTFSVDIDCILSWVGHYRTLRIAVYQRFFLRNPLRYFLRIEHRRCSATSDSELLSE